MTTQARELAKLVTNAGDVNLGDDISLASDGAILNFGADNDVTLTHVADTGLLLNSSRQLQFGDSDTYIRQSADAVLQLNSDTEVEINATTVDINANVDISGNLVLGGNITIGDADSDDISFGGELTSHIIPNADDTYDLGSSTKQWRNAYVDGTLYVDAIDLDGSALTAFNADAAQVFNESGNDADFRVESSGNANRFFIDGGANSGEGAVVVGHNASLGQHRAFQISGNSPDTSGMEMFKYTNDTTGPTISMSKSRGGSIGTAAAVNDNDIVGTINWFADDGTDTGNYVATIHAEIDGTPGSNDTPGALVFGTTADGANTQTERMRIGATGRASWAAGGVGTVGTQARDFTFYTEGSTNGVAIHSNDERLIFMGAAASSGTGVDTGYFQIENGGTAKIALNSNGDSYFSGGNVAINGAENNIDRTFTIGTGAAKTSTTTIYPFAIQTNESSAAGRLSMHYTGADAAADRKVIIQMEEEGVANAGIISLNPHGGTVGIGTSSPARTLHVNSGDANIASFEGHQGEGLVISSGTNGRIDLIGYDDGASAYNNLVIRVSGSYDQLLFDSSGHIGIPPGRRFYLDNTSISSGDTYIDEYSANEVGITTGGSRKLAVSGGNLYVSGSVNANHNFSDERLKENIVVIPNALEKVSTLRGITFKRKADGSVGTGLIAQELEAVLPEAVYEAKSIESLEDSDAVEYKGIRYETTVGLLVEAIKELEARVKVLEG